MNLLNITTMMNDDHYQQTLLQAAIRVMDSVKDNRQSDEYLIASALMSRLLRAPHLSVLRSLLHEGPLKAANVSSPQALNELIQAGLAVQVCFHGEPGYIMAHSYVVHLIPRHLASALRETGEEHCGE